MIKVAERKDVPDGEALAVDVGEDRVAVFNVEGKFYATSDICPHSGGRLSDGWVNDGQVTCPWHGWTFPLDAAQADNDGLLRYKVHVNGDTISIELPD